MGKDRFACGRHNLPEMSHFTSQIVGSVMFRIFDFSFSLSLNIQTILMNAKTIKITYWILVSVFSAFMIMDGIGGLMMGAEGKEAMKALGYPDYIMLILGTAKILGAIGLLQTRSVLLKEWACAGFAFNFIGASLSWSLAGGPALFAIIPLIPLLFLFVVYYFRRKYDKIVRLTSATV